MTLKTILLSFTLFFLSNSLIEKPLSYKNNSSENNSPLYLTPKPVGNIHMVIDKSDYELHVFDANGWYATYPVVFGNNSLGDKKMEGDKNTPEGTFSINSMRPHNKWHKFISIDYPNEASWKKFKERKSRGEIPSTARIGGSIGIHGTWPHEDYQIDRYNNWTEGCISLKNDDIDHLYNYLKVGTPLVIRK
jgi:murein L,D-transpeptidase YafK